MKSETRFEYSWGRIDSGEWHFKSTSRDGVGLLNNRFDNFIKELGLNPELKKISKFGYCVVEAATNSIEARNDATAVIELSFDRVTSTLSCVVTDNAGGFSEDPKTYIIQGHGLWDIKRYMDTFSVENIVGGRE